MCFKKPAVAGFSFLVLCTVMGLPMQIRGETPGPAQVISCFNVALIEAMRGGKELGFRGRYRLLQPVVTETFLLPYMASVSVGRHWKTLTEEQQRQFEEIYAEWSIANYAKNFDEYAGERFEITKQSQTAGGAAVVSKLLDFKGKETEFDYRLRLTEGAWRIVDMRISGVSQLANTRAQFMSVLDQKGFDELLASLKRKLREFSQGDGQ
jgi:phospholipid transport system substrate-binding protein